MFGQCKLELLCLLVVWRTAYSEVVNIPFNFREPRPELLEVHIITPSLYSTRLIGTYHFIGPAFDSALADIKRFYPALNVTHHVLHSTDYNIDDCNVWNDNIENLVAETYNRIVKVRATCKQACTSAFVIAVITGGCGDGAVLARLAQEWNIVYITSIVALSKTRQKLAYPTWFTTTVNTMSTYAKIYRALAQRCNWKSFVLLVDLGSNTYFETIARAILPEFSARDGYQTHYLTFNSSKSPVDYAGFLKLIKTTGQVCFYFGHSTPLRDFLVAASKLNMTSGEKIYVAMTPFRHTMLGNFTWKFGDQYDEVTRRAFDSLLLVESEFQRSCEDTDATACKDYSNIWKRKSADMYSYPYPNDTSVTPHPGSSYAAVMIFAQELYTANSSYIFTDGSSLTKHFLNRTYALDTGDIVLSEKGERILQLNVRQMANSSEFETIFSQDANTLELHLVTEVTRTERWIKSSKLQHPSSGHSHFALLACGLLLLSVSGGVFLVLRLRAYRHAHGWWRISSSHLVRPRYFRDSRQPRRNTFQTLRAGVLSIPFLSSSTSIVSKVTSLWHS